MNGKEIHDSISRLKYSILNHTHSNLDVALYDLLFASAKLMSADEYVDWDDKISNTLTIQDQVNTSTALIKFVIDKLEKRRTMQNGKR